MKPRKTLNKVANEMKGETVTNCVKLILLCCLLGVPFFGACKTEEQKPSPRVPVKETKPKPTGEKTVRYTKENPPRFGDFPAPADFQGKPAVVDLTSHRDARRFRTQLMEGAKKGPNFAGHYTVVTWGCGTSCQVVALVDARTGTVYFAPFVTELGSQYRINSTLFIKNPPEEIRVAFDPQEVPDWLVTEYYTWENNQFVLLFATKP